MFEEKSFEDLPDLVTRETEDDSEVSSMINHIEVKEHGHNYKLELERQFKDNCKSTVQWNRLNELEKRQKVARKPKMNKNNND